MTEVTKEEFNEYINCQKSGITNMFNVKNVEMITGLEKKKILYIMEHYGELKKKYSDDLK